MANSKFLDLKAASLFFLNTFHPQHQTSQNIHKLAVLMRFIIALDAAARKVPNGLGITFSGQKPNDIDLLVYYLINGGRIFFDITHSSLHPADRLFFQNFLLPLKYFQLGTIYPRIAGTHDLGVIKNSMHKKFEQTIYEKKLTGFEGALNAIKRILSFRPTNHFGVDIAVGGNGNKLINYEGKLVEIKDNGEFGHLYTYIDQRAILFGIEESAPLKRFVPGGGWHGPDGKGTVHSACMTHRLRNQSFGNGLDTIIPKCKNGPYTWNRVLITKEVIEELKQIEQSNQLDPNQTNINKVVAILSNPPANAEKVIDFNKRNEDILDYRKNLNLFKPFKIDSLISKEGKENMIDGLVSYFKKFNNNPFKKKGIERCKFYIQLLKAAKNNRPLSKLAALSEVGGGTERKPGAYIEICEELSTVPTNKFTSAVEFRKRSNLEETILFYAILVNNESSTLQNEVCKHLGISQQDALTHLKVHLKKCARKLCEYDENWYHLAFNDLENMIKKIINHANTQASNIHALQDTVHSLNSIHHHIEANRHFNKPNPFFYLPFAKESQERRIESRNEFSIQKLISFLKPTVSNIFSFFKIRSSLDKAEESEKIVRRASDVAISSRYHEH